MTAATYSSFSLAAKYMHMSKPAITKQIQVLESQLNIKLFSKHGRGLRITDKAKRLLPQVKTILEEANKMKKVVELGLDQTKPLLLFTTGHTHARLLFSAMKQFSTQYEFEYEVFVEPHDRSLKRFEESNADFWITSSKIDNPDVIHVPFFKYNFYLVGGKTNALIPAGRMTIADLCDIPFLQIKAEQHQEKLQSKNEYIKQYFHKIIQLESYHSIQDAIKSNLGIGILPDFLLCDDCSSLRVLPISQLQFSRQIYIVSNKNLTKIKERFLEYIKTDFKINPLN